MKVAYITSAYGRASDTFIRNEVGQLRSAGVTVGTFSVRKPEDSHAVDTAIRAERDQTVYLLEQGALQLATAAVAEAIGSPRRFIRAVRLVHQLTGNGLRSRLRECAYLLEAASLARHLRAGQYQHVHDHIGENSAVVAVVAAALVGVSCSMTLHGPSVFYAPEHFRLSKKVAVSTFTVCISQFARSQCMVSCDPANWAKLRIVHCAVGQEYVQSQPSPVPDAPCLLMVGRLSPEKAPTVLLDAVAMLLRKGVRIELQIVGDGPSRRDIERRIGELRLGNCVHLLGWQSSTEIAARMQQCRALVLPSFAEGLPVVLMEALALGRPVVTTWVAGIPELVEQGRNGWLVPPGSAEALASAMEQVLATPVERLTAMGRCGREKVLREHNAAIEAAELAKLFEKAVAHGELAGGRNSLPLCPSDLEYRC